MASGSPPPPSAAPLTLLPREAAVPVQLGRSPAVEGRVHLAERASRAATVEPPRSSGGRPGPVGGLPADPGSSPVAGPSPGHENARAGAMAAPSPAGARASTGPGSAPDPAPNPGPNVDRDVEPPPPGAGEWRPMRVNPDGTAVQYDPCRTIPYVTRITGGPSFARSELEWAIGQIERASGLDLAWAGDVAEPMSSAWPTDGPLHLGFATAEEFEMPAGASGYGDSWTADDGEGRRRYTGGRVVLRPDHGWTEGAASANPLGLMFLHELGHVVGLAHVSAPGEVMTDRGNGSARSLGSGDQAGLAAVGRHGACP